MTWPMYTVRPSFRSRLCCDSVVTSLKISAYLGSLDETIFLGLKKSITRSHDVLAKSSDAEWNKRRIRLQITSRVIEKEERATAGNRLILYAESSWPLLVSIGQTRHLAEPFLISPVLDLTEARRIQRDTM